MNRSEKLFHIATTLLVVAAVATINTVPETVTAAIGVAALGVALFDHRSNKD